MSLKSDTTSGSGNNNSKNSNRITHLLAMFQTYWKSIALVTLILTTDLLTLLGGLHVPLLRVFSWIELPQSLSFGLWNPQVALSQDAMALLWWIRILTSGKMILSLVLVHLLSSYHVMRMRLSQGNEALADGTSRWLVTCSAWHILCTAVQMTTFWFVMLAQVGVMSFSDLGPSAIISSVAVIAEVALLAVTLNYRRIHDEWAKMMGKDLNF